MKNLILLICALQVHLLLGQNTTISLGTFDNFTGSCPLGQHATPRPFIDSSCDTKGWFASHGSPHLESNKFGNSTTFIQMFDAAPDNIQSLSGEGVFREYSFQAGTTYLLSFRFLLETIIGQQQGGEVHFLPNLYVRLTNQLDAPPPFPGLPGLLYPTITDAQVVFNESNIQATNEWITFHASFTPTSNYSQLWFVGENRQSEPPGVVGWSYIDDVELIEDYQIDIVDGCCPESASYANTSNLPSLTEVNDFIDAGPNVTVQFGQNVVFKAGNRITLEDGFTAENGSLFVAVAEDCSDPLTLSFDLARSFCDATLTPVICGGTGFYNYEWSTGEITQSISFTPTSSSTYSLTLTDGGTGNSVTSNIVVGPDSEFNGNFSVYIPNVFTPNGDGVNDTWEVRDANVGTGPLKAYEYDLVIVDRNGLNVYDDDGSNPAGYNGGDIFWDGKNNGGSWVVNAVYFWALTLKNCDYPSGQTFNGTVQVLGSPGSVAAPGDELHVMDEEEESDEKEESDEEEKSEEKQIKEVVTENPLEDSFEFWPNPTTNLMSVDYSISEGKRFLLMLIDIEGRVVQVLEDRQDKLPGRYSSQYAIDMLPSGIYFVHYETSKTKELSKLIIK